VAGESWGAASGASWSEAEKVWPMAASSTESYRMGKKEGDMVKYLQCKPSCRVALHGSYLCRSRDEIWCVVSWICQVRVELVDKKITCIMFHPQLIYLHLFLFQYVRHYWDVMSCGDLCLPHDVLWWGWAWGIGSQQGKVPTVLYGSTTSSSHWAQARLVQQSGCAGDARLCVLLGFHFHHDFLFLFFPSEENKGFLLVS